MTGNRDPLDPLDLDALEAAARARLEAGVYDFIAGGADAERTVADNLAAWSRLRLRPRVLRDVTEVATATTLLGSQVPTPLLVAPMAYHRMAHPDGEAGSAAGAAAAGALYVCSTQATMSVEEVAAAAPEAARWFQVYVVRDRGWTAELVARAAAAGYRALVLTVDVPQLGNRLRDLHNQFRLPAGVEPANAPPLGAGRQRELATDVLAQAGQFDPGLTPETIGWLAERSGLPVVVKGVLRGDDAVACVEAGAAGVVVSNHGGRQLDTVVATADALAEVAAAVGTGPRCTWTAGSAGGPTCSRPWPWGRGVCWSAARCCGAWRLAGPPGSSGCCRAWPASSGWPWRCAAPSSRTSSFPTCSPGSPGPRRGRGPAGGPGAARW